ncbi:hypothetical protein ABZY20_10595 [Streptomyces sp. NPDC006624]|uniref:hypothetical protein n=1 Tax=Streptomyces sp. NPDC006624 TaxID=3154892 RepID=UPI0033B04BF3
MRGTDDVDGCGDGVPELGTAVRDTVRDRVGRVVGHQGRCLRVRPLGGGREWDADPRDVRPLSQDELLSALLAEVNARSRQGRGTGQDVSSR